MKIIYIAGMSRSGTTILERTLHRDYDIFAFGELRRAAIPAIQPLSCSSLTLTTDKCACGKTLTECTFWSSIMHSASVCSPYPKSVGTLKRLAFEVAVLSLPIRTVRWLAVRAPRIGFADSLTLAENYLAICREISKKSNKALLIDSSKNIHHYIALKAVAPAEIKLVFMMRDGRAVANSSAKAGRLTGSEKECQSQFRSRKIKVAARSWVKVNLLGLILTRLPFRSHSHACLIKYEEFCLHGHILIQELLQDLNLLEDTKKRRHFDDSDTVEHAIGGSPSRHASGSKEVVLDTSWKNQWSNQDSISFGRVARALNYMLGYR